MKKFDKPVFCSYCSQLIYDWEQYSEHFKNTHFLLEDSFSNKHNLSDNFIRIDFDVDKVNEFNEKKNINIVWREKFNVLDITRDIYIKE